MKKFTPNVNYPIQVLRDEETVLMKRIDHMKDDKNRKAAEDRLDALRDGINILLRANRDYFEDAFRAKYLKKKS